MVAAFAVAVVLSGAAAAATTVLTLREDRPTTAEAGQVLLVKGSDCQAGGTARVLLDGGDIATVRVDPAGRFAAQANIPADSPLGQHELTTSCTGRNDDAFTIAVVAPAPVEAIVGTVPEAEQRAGLDLKGAGFPADSQVDITLDGARLGSIPSRADGTFNDHLDLPSSVGLGEHTITASTGETAATTTVTIIR